MIAMLLKLRMFIERCSRALGVVSGLLILVMGIMLAYEVVSRYVFNSPTIWAQEIAIYLYMWTMLAAAAYTLQVKKHISVDLVIVHLPIRARALLEIATNAIGVIFCAVVVVQAYEMIAATLQFGKVSATPLRVPLWIPQSALLIGFLLLIFQFAFNIVDRVVDLGTHGQQGGGAA
jgi:TRAP-type C4-dicarboxylate transport system permease small subunit